jgi:hypothetical protein
MVCPATSRSSQRQQHQQQQQQQQRQLAMQVLQLLVLLCHQQTALELLLHSQQQLLYLQERSCLAQPLWRLHLVDKLK